MSASVAEVTPGLLREWGLPSSTGSKYERGRVLVLGGAARTPGAVELAGLAALRVGAGQLKLVVAESVAAPLAVAVPEASVIGLAQNARGSVLADDLTPILDDLASADAVLVGPGLDDVEHTARLLQVILRHLGESTMLVLDAYGLAPLPGLRDLAAGLEGRLLLTPNTTEAEVLLERESGDLLSDRAEIAARYRAVVCGDGVVVAPDGQQWRVHAGHGGLGTSGSGDVLAGALAGLLARGVEAPQAGCWATYLHAAAGDRLAAQVGRLGFLAREIVHVLPAVLVELEA